MKLSSQSFDNGRPIPAAFAAGVATGFAGNRNPQLAWSEVPAGTRSFALVCVDPDVPTVPELVGRDDVSIPLAQPRGDFIHWVMVDIPASLREIASKALTLTLLALIYGGAAWLRLTRAPAMPEHPPATAPA